MRPYAAQPKAYIFPFFTQFPVFTTVRILIIRYESISKLAQNMNIFKKEYETK
jgi:hypothetical protein